MKQKRHKLQQKNLAECRMGWMDVHDSVIINDGYEDYVIACDKEN